MGVTEVIHMQQPYSNIHIDGLMNAASNDVVMVHASQVPYDVLDVLKRKGYKVLEALSTTEVRETFGCNFVALSPGLVLMPEESPLSGSSRRKRHQSADGRRFGNHEGRGALHCITAFLKRG